MKIIDLKKNTATPISLEKELKDDDESHISDFVSEDVLNGPKYQVENNELKEKINNFLRSQLSQEEFEIVCLRYGFDNEHEPMTLEDIARYKKLTKDKVRNIETKA
jgi:RNA polymerase primary sigma factor